MQTWISPNGEHRNQIDHVAINGKFRSVQDVRVNRGAHVGSDHNLLVMKIRLRLHKAERSPTTSRRYETSKLKVPLIKEKFSIELKNRFSILNNYEESEIGDIWNNLRAAWNEQQQARWDIERRRIKNGLVTTVGGFSMKEGPSKQR